MIVVDASVLIAAFAEQGNDAVWARKMSANPDMHGPDLIFAEVMNGLRRSELNRDISTVQAEFALKDLLRADLNLYPFMPFAERIWELRHNLTCYDAWYVALAESLDCPLVTLDRRISRAGGVRCEVLTPPNTGS